MGTIDSLHFATEQEFDDAIAEWTADGYSFVGNVTMPYHMDDLRYEPELPTCPMCGDPGFFTALWEKSPRGHSIQRCYECGHQWIEHWDDESESGE